jgi:hypothetical protein
MCGGGVAMSREGSRLAAILVADVAGFSAFGSQTEVKADSRHVRFYPWKRTSFCTQLTSASGHKRNSFTRFEAASKPSARYYASADKLGNGAGNGFGLLQQHEMSRTRQVDNPDAIAELLAERVAISRRSRYVIEPLDHKKRGRSGAPPIFERHPPASCDVGEKHRPATVFSDPTPATASARPAR